MLTYADVCRFTHSISPYAKLRFSGALAECILKALRQTLGYLKLLLIGLLLLLLLRQCYRWLVRHNRHIKPLILGSHAEPPD
eukprot:13182_4